MVLTSPALAAPIRLVPPRNATRAIAEKAPNPNAASHAPFGTAAGDGSAPTSADSPAAATAVTVVIIAAIARASGPSVAAAASSGPVAAGGDAPPGAPLTSGR